MSEFDFKCEVSETTWLVDSLIPMGHLCFVLAQAGIGKSLVIESLAVHLIHAIPFAGFKTVEGDVLLIDQDTPQNVLVKRILQFAKGLDTAERHKLFLESMNGYSLSDNSLIGVIHKYPTAKLVLIDSLHSICGRLDPNSTTDMNKWSRVKEACLNNENTIIVNHHITQKGEFPVDRLMLGESGNLSMGSSAIMQQADTYYVVGATAKEGKTERIYLRPVSKRVSVPQKPIVLRLIQPEHGGEAMLFDGYYEPSLDEVEQDIMVLFREQNIERTVKEIYEAMGHRHGEITTREALASLDKKGILLLSRHKSNLFKYKLP